MTDYDVAITTTDNPYDPLDDFDKWYFYDTAILGYCTCAYLARIAKVSGEMSDENYKQEVERAIDEICKFNLNGKYVKVKKVYDE